jgi:hypothetical protein
MSTLAHPDPVSQSVSILVTDRHIAWPPRLGGGRDGPAP